MDPDPNLQTPRPGRLRRPRAGSEDPQGETGHELSVVAAALGQARHGQEAVSDGFDFEHAVALRDGVVRGENGLEELRNRGGTEEKSGREGEGQVVACVESAHDWRALRWGCECAEFRG